MITKAMILASGRGEGMMPLTRDIPKPMLRIGDITLIEDKILRLAESGIKEIIVNVGYLGSQIIDHIGDGSKFGISIKISDEGEGPIGTGDGIRKVIKFFDEQPFIVVNADIWTNYLFIDLNEKLFDQSLAHIILVDNPPQHDGDFSLNKQSIVSGKDFTFSGIGIYKPELFKLHSQKELGEILKIEKNITGELYKGLWEDVGTPERLDQIRKSLSNN